MRKELVEAISGAGFLQVSERQKKILAWVLGVSLGAHVVGLAIFGGWIIIRGERDTATVFVAPPPLKTYQPRELEHRVKVQQKQRSSSRPSMVPRLVSSRVSSLALPEITLDPKVINTSFQPKFRAVSGTGLGVGVGTGYGTGGFGTGVSSYNFFGIRGRSDRVAIILDTSLSMAEESEELGVTPAGIAQYARVKERVAEVIDAFSPEMMFNLIVYAQTASQWRDEMQVATADNKRDAIRYMAPLNSRADWNSVGHTSGISHLSYGMGDRAGGGTTRFDIALSLAFKSRPDTILIICDGDVWTVRAHTQDEMQAHNDAVERWRRQNASALARRDASRTTERVWVEGRPAQSAALRERGGRQASGPTEGRWVERTVTNHRGNIPPQPRLPEIVWSLTDYQRHISALHEEFLAPHGRGMPSIHIIGFRSGREDSDFLRQLARAYHGQFRRVTQIARSRR